MPKIVDHTAYRAQLLEGCADLFAQHGYQRLSMRRIATELGVSTGTLYHYFAGKRELFLALVEHLTEQLVEVVGKELAAGCSPGARLDALLADVAAREDWYARYNRICLDHLRERDPDAERVMATTMRAVAAALRDALDLDEPTARFVFVYLFGLVTERDLDGSAVPFDEQADLLRTFVTQRRSAGTPSAGTPSAGTPVGAELADHGHPDLPRQA